MQTICFDVETHLIRQGCVAPKLVCVSVAEEGKPTLLYDAKDGVAWFWNVIRDSNVTLVNHHIVFDLLVMCAEDARLVPYVFRAIDAGRVRCTLLRERLMDNAQGKLVSETVKGYYSLEGVAGRRLGAQLDKAEDGWRLRYAELDGVPIEAWPERAVLYSKFDAVWALALHDEQQRVANTGREQPRWDAIPDEIALMRATWALALMSAWGVRTDPVRVATYKKTLETDLAAISIEAKKEGLVREDGTRDEALMKGRLERVLASRNIKAEYTAKKGISLAGEQLEKAGNVCNAWPECGGPGKCQGTEETDKDEATLPCEGDPLLVMMKEYNGLKKLLSTYVKKLEVAARHPLNPRYTSLVKTGRTSASDNAQTPPRKGGVRGCFIPREGWVFAGADFDGAEMRSWAQVCLDLIGHSKLAALYQANPDADPHCTMGAILLGVPEEEFIARYKADDPIAKEYRQQSKPPNFGFPGGMGEDTMIGYAAGQGIKLTMERAKQARAAWRKAWTENFDYFKLITSITSGPGKRGTIKQLRSGRIRGGVSFTEAANGFFQALTADGAKRALWYVSWECYVGTIYNDDATASPLAGCRPVMFLHDEIIAEMPEGIAHVAAPRMADVMVAGMREFLPDVPVRAAPVLMRRWIKGARPKFNAEGRLIPFEDAAPTAKAA